MNIKEYKRLLVILCDCESWSVTVKEKCKLQVFEKRILRKIFGLKQATSDIT
jgi:hypothetical protein